MVKRRQGELVFPTEQKPIKEKPAMTQNALMSDPLIKQRNKLLLEMSKKLRIVVDFMVVPQIMVNELPQKKE